MPLKMGIMKMNLFRGVKIGFIGILVVSKIFLPLVFLMNMTNIKASFLWMMAMPSVEKFLERGVMVEVSTLPLAKNGQPTLEPVTAPAVTFCPYKDLK